MPREIVAGIQDAELSTDPETWEAYLRAREVLERVGKVGGKIVKVSDELIRGGVGLVSPQNRARSSFTEGELRRMANQDPTFVNMLLKGGRTIFGVGVRGNAHNGPIIIVPDSSDLHSK